MTLSEITSNITLTEKESKVLSYIYDELSGNFGELVGIGCTEVANALNVHVKTIKGIVGSLVKKGILTTYETVSGYEVVVFVDQEDMEYMG